MRITILNEFDFFRWNVEPRDTQPTFSSMWRNKRPRERNGAPGAPWGAAQSTGPRSSK